MQVLGNAHLYPECDLNNHERLQEPGRRDENNQPSQVPDGNLTAGWYRIDSQAGERLLDITDIPKNTLDRNLVRLLLVSIHLKKLVMLLNNLITLRNFK